MLLAKKYFFIFGLIAFNLIFLLMGCTQNIGQVWVNDLDQEARPKSLPEKEKISSIKSASNTYLQNKQILHFSPFAKPEVPKKFLALLEKESNNFFLNTISKDLINEKKLTPIERNSIFNKHQIFLEDFLTFFRVNKDLAKKLSEDTKQEILIFPQVIFWPCLNCEEKNLLYLRLSMVDLKMMRLIWFSDNYYQFSELPNEKEQMEKGIELYLVILNKFNQSFGQI